MAFSKKDMFEERYSHLADYAKALSHPARIAILALLAKRNTCICGEIVEVMPLAQSTVSQHLRELRKAGLVVGEIDGPRSCYCVNRAKISELSALFSDLFGSLDEGCNAADCCAPVKKERNNN